MKEEDIDKIEEKEDKHEIEKNKKTRRAEQKKEYMNYIKGVMNKKGFNPKLKKNKFLGGVRGRG